MDIIEQNTQRVMRYLQAAAETDYIGEAVSQLEHALQCAYFAEKSGHSSDVVLASLFHDIGHFASATEQHAMADLGVVNHEWIGAKLAHDMGFSANAALLIGYHVDAKRYLAGKKAHYYARLSEASRGTLAFQGGPMADAERQLFEEHPCFREILQVRVNDEKGKEIGLAVPSLDYYYPFIKKHIASNIENKLADNEPALTDYIDDQWVMKLKRHLEAGL